MSFYRAQIRTYFFFPLFMGGLVCLLLFPKLALAEEEGYREAQAYFLARKNNKRQPASASSSWRLSRGKAGNSKYFVSLALGQNTDWVPQVQIGRSLLKSKYVQQSMFLEWSKSLQGEGRQSFQFFNEIQLSSEIFLLGPYFALGGGLGFSDKGQRESLISYQTGLFLNNRWSQSYLLSFILFYQQERNAEMSRRQDFFGLRVRIGI